MYYVYRASSGYPTRWSLASTHETEAEAVEAARLLCPKGAEIYTEPGRGLNMGFFGSARSDKWSAMVTTEEYNEAA